MLPHMPDDASGRQSFVTLDITADEGWAQALDGAGALVHTASPFPLVQARSEAELIRPILPVLDRFERKSNAKASDVQGIKSKPAGQAVRGAGRWPVENGIA